jgi:hypothetical protein
MICTHCGHFNSNENTFCTYCGQLVSATATGSTHEASPAPASRSTHLLNNRIFSNTSLGFLIIGILFLMLSLNSGLWYLKTQQEKFDFYKNLDPYKWMLHMGDIIKSLMIITAFLFARKVFARTLIAIIGFILCIHLFSTTSDSIDRVEANYERFFKDRVRD